jgi:hypothetical protein
VHFRHSPAGEIITLFDRFREENKISSLSELKNNLNVKTGWMDFEGDLIFNHEDE